MKTSAISKVILEQLCVYLEKKEPLALLTVIDRSGSGPREAGAMMIVDREGRSFGTIGGGVLEAQAKVLAEKVILEAQPAVKNYHLTNRDASDLGMICGGRMEILADHIPGGDLQWSTFIRRLTDNCGRGRPGCLIRSIKNDGNLVHTGLGIADDAGFDAGSLDLTQFDPEIVAPGCLKTGTRLLERGGIRYFIQTAGVPGTIFIFGAGHVGEALAPLCHFVGFRTVIIDDRGDFANKERFPLADNIHVPESFDAFFSDVELNESDYIVIITSWPCP